MSKPKCQICGTGLFLDSNNSSLWFCDVATCGMYGKPQLISKTVIEEKNPNKCELCGEPMPPGEEMFKYHGYSGTCPVPAALGGQAVSENGPYTYIPLDGAPGKFGLSGPGFIGNTNIRALELNLVANTAYAQGRLSLEAELKEAREEKERYRNLLEVAETLLAENSETQNWDELFSLGEAIGLELHPERLQIQPAALAPSVAPNEEGKETQDVNP